MRKALSCREMHGSGSGFDACQKHAEGVATGGGT